MKLAELDTAKRTPCQYCGIPVRCLNVPIAGTNRDPEYAQRATCELCLQAKTSAAVAGIPWLIARATMRQNLVGLIAGR